MTTVNKSDNQQISWEDKLLLYDKLNKLGDRLGGDCFTCNYNCCTNMMIRLNRNEISSVSNYLKISKSEFRKKYTHLCQEGEYAVTFNGKKNIEKLTTTNEQQEQMIKEWANRRVLLFEIIDQEHPWHKGGTSICPFLEENKRCKIHSVRFGDCRYYPFEMVFMENAPFLQLRDVNRCLKTTAILIAIRIFFDYYMPDEDLIVDLKSVIDVMWGKEIVQGFPIPLPIMMDFVDMCSSYNMKDVVLGNKGGEK